MAIEEDTPGVSYVMPVLNESRYLETAVRTVLAQDYDGEKEVVLALGPSTDNSDEIAERLAATDDRIVLVRNPNTDIPAGMNVAIRTSRNPIVVRVDAHSELESVYTRLAIETLRRTGAANVGGVMHARGKTPFQAAAARAYNSRFGLGGGSYHSGVQQGPAESAYLGVFLRDALEAVNFYDESLKRGEDWELNLRIRASGRVVWFDPALRVTYWPRENWPKLVRQFVATGVWRAELVRRYRRRNPWRFFVPPALLIVVVLSLAVAILQLTRVLTGPASLITSAIYLGPLAYLVLLVVLAFVIDKGETIKDRMLFLLVLPTMHLSWAAGFLVGLVFGARDTVDTSRTEL